MHCPLSLPFYTIQKQQTASCTLSLTMCLASPYIIDALAAMHARVKRRQFLVSYYQTGIYTFV
jgi:hypothetical protein